MNPLRKKFSQVRLIFTLLLLLAILSLVLTWTIHEKRKQISNLDSDLKMSVQLADELRQSSDDLSMMARLYVLTGDTLYKQYFNTILSIRDGKISRPIDYHDIYWDFVLSTQRAPRPNGESISFEDLLNNHCNADEAIDYLSDAKRSSDELTRIENQAFKWRESVSESENVVIKGTGIELLHNEAYFKAKGKIMRSIQDFSHFLDEYHKKEILKLQFQLNDLNLALVIVIIFAIIVICILIFIMLRMNRYIDSKKAENQKNITKGFKWILHELGKSWSLLVSTAVFSLLILLMFYFIERMVRKNIEENLSQSISSVMETTKQNILTWLSDIENKIEHFKANEKIEHELQNAITMQDNNEFRNLIDLGQRYFTDNSFRGIAIIDKESKLIFSSIPNLLGTNIIQLDDQSFYNDLINLQNGIVNSFPKNNGISSKYNHYIKIGYSHFNTTNQYLGSILFFFDPQERFTEVLQWGRIGESGESYAFNRDGEMISESRFNTQLIEMGFIEKGQLSELNIEIRDPGKNMTLQENRDKKPENMTLTLMANNAIKGYDGLNIEGYNDYRGVKVIGVWGWIERFGFGITTEIDHSEAYKTLFLIRNLSLYSSLTMILLLSILVGFFIYNRIKLSNLNEEIDKQASLLSSLLNGIPDVVVYKDKDKKYIGGNAAFEKLLGKKQSDLQNKTAYDLFPQEMAQKIDIQDDEILNKGVAKLFEDQHSLEDGSTTTFETLITPFYDKEAKLLGIIGISRDITEKKNLLQEIYDQKKLLEDTLESLSHPFYVIDVKTFEILIANTAAKKYTKGGVTTCHALTHHSETPCDSENDPCPVKIVMETKKPTIVEHIHFDHEGNEMYVEVHGYPVFNQEGEVIQMIEYSLDITERKKIEEEIIASENKFRSIMTSATDGIVSTNAKGEIISWNDAAEKIFGYKENEIIGQNVELIIPEKHVEGHRKGMDRVIKTGKKKIIGEVVELTGKTKEDLVLPIEMSLSKWDSKGEVNFTSIIRDITERKKMESIILKSKERMEKELNVAKDIQMSMLPLIFPAFPKRNELDVYANLLPAREVGGDFYDFFFIDDNHFCFVVGDVSGKGVPAALLMAVTKTLLKSRASADLSTSSILTHVNNEIAKDNHNYMFITIFIAILNTNNGELVYSNAGHNPSFILNSTNNKFEKLGELHGPVIGAMENMTYKESKVSLEVNDCVFAYTDGVTESQNIHEQLYSDNRLVNLLKGSKFRNSKELLDEVLTDVKLHEKDCEQFDDITLLNVRYLKSGRINDENQLRTSISNDLINIPTIIRKFEKFGKENNLPDKIIQKINIVFDELINNIISYAFEDGDEHEIIVNTRFNGERLVIIIEDNGKAFNPFKQDPPDTMLSIDQRLIGGLGIHLVQNLMDEFNYKRNVDTNVITLVKNITKD